MAKRLASLIVCLSFLASTTPATLVPADAGLLDGGSAALDAGAPIPSSCIPCVSAIDCEPMGERCIQLPTDAVCGRLCQRNADCAPAEVCAPFLTTEGEHVGTCLAIDGTCQGIHLTWDAGASDGGPLDAGEADAGLVDAGLPDAGVELDAGHEEDAGVPDAGPPDAGGYCEGLALPDVPDTCCHCASGHTCAANHCYGGYLCDPGQCHCVAPPMACLPAGGIVGSVDGRTGGKVNRLYFGAVGDTRPAIINDTANYPTNVINHIYADVAALSPLPEFMIATGDYVFASTGRTEAAAQLSLYAQARQQFSNPLWAALGNHECTGYTSSNCGTGNTNGITANYTAFINTLLTPIGETDPWFVRRVDALDSSWTAKFIFLAPNAWSDAQKAWFTAELARPTTYTFIIHHEPAASGTDSPGIPDINAIVSGAAVTLSIVGHTHTWRKTSGAAEVIVGNGGAPLDGVPHYGYTLFEQRADGAIVVTAYDYADNTSFASFAVKADGSVAN